MKPRIVLSGVNFVEAGPLSIFRDALHDLSTRFADRFEIIGLVHRSSLFDVPNVTFIEFPAIKGSWLRRLRFEYWDCRALSLELRPYLWLAMHDMTPNVTAPVRAVYCHNPSPFHKLRLEDARGDWKFALFTLLYRFLYSVNLQKNDFVILQQQWAREQFLRLFKASKTVVAHPSIPNLVLPDVGPARAIGCMKLFYPALARPFKNHGTLLRCIQILEERAVSGVELWLTIDGTENAYAAQLFSRYGGLRSVRWLGKMPRERVCELYAESDCLLFPSLLETWGMPISEFRQTGKPMLLADLPYAHETAGEYPLVHFFEPENAAMLAKAIEEFVDAKLMLKAAPAAPVQLPFAADWSELFTLLLQDAPPRG